MKHVIVILFYLISFNAFAQTEFDGKKWGAPYALDVPAGWDVERFLIPIEFAPEIHYKGIEDLRFTPGWGNAKSDEYWTYAFLWYLDETPETNESIIEQNLTIYYTGLISRNIEKRKIPADKIFQTKVLVKKAKTEQGDIKTYTASIYMLDYMEQKPMTLNCIVHLKSCAGQPKAFMFYEISPKPFTDQQWKSLNQLWVNFKCSK